LATEIRSDRTPSHYAIVSLHDNKLIGDIQLDTLRGGAVTVNYASAIGLSIIWWDQGYGTDASLRFFDTRLEA